MASSPAASLAELDQALAAWRERLAAASRNVAELSELPAFLALKAATRAEGAGASPEARTLVATVEELWQGVLLLGEALSRAEAARTAASRLWMPFGTTSAATVTDLLEGKSIGIRVGDSPVLHRRLLSGAADTIWVTPAQLLATMEAAFDSARAILGRTENAAAEAQAARERAVASFADARRLLAEVEQHQKRANDAVARASALVVAELPSSPLEQTHELPGWLDRLQRIWEQGRTEACAVGLANWTALARQTMAGWDAVANAAEQALTRRDELRGRFAALQAKQASRYGQDASLAEVSAAARAALFGGRIVLDEAGRLMAAYEAALARAF